MKINHFFPCNVSFCFTSTCLLLFLSVNQDENHSLHMMSWSCDRRLPCCCFHEYLWVLHVRHQPIAAQACVKTALCAKGADGMVIKNRFAWYSAHVHVRLWIWKYFVCWCACHFDHMFKVHVWIGVNVQFPARGWHICMRECVCGWGQGLMRAVCVCVFACERVGTGEWTC